MLKSRRRGLSPDPELGYVGAMFHDLGLTPKYRTQHQRFEVDGAGMKDRPETTFATMNDDVLAHFDPHFNREDFVNIIARWGWPE